MKRNIDGLRAADTSNPNGVPDGDLPGAPRADAISKVRAEGVLQRGAFDYRTEALRRKHHIQSHLLPCESTWKPSWFLRDFGYNAELLGRNEVDEKRAVGLTGVVKISNVVYDGMALLRFDGFAPASRWEELSPTNPDRQAS
jgi:hypothetical protein